MIYFSFRPPDYTKGIFQTLGFKEFHKYLILSEENKNTDDGRKLLKQSIENMKIATKRYAKRQNKMVRGRFLDIPRREVIFISIYYHLVASSRTKKFEVYNIYFYPLNTLL